MHMLVDVIVTGVAVVSMMGVARQRKMLIERHVQISNLTNERDVIETDRRRLYQLNSELNVLVDHLDSECELVASKNAELCRLVSKWVPLRSVGGKFARKVQ